ncbi:response regulator [Aureibacter tunicatorum]|uniref:Response regulatory domain-containing protein n=1 Tax=Aureibacter tunicatorum TaxID=866807 RepID=A0AAE3XNB4_9BACT|nr:response regulator [Aureibacter tunicatorum]MDR6239039.1 hypothetical protein [Aureibacter tunicatorum]BDD05035.1 response regulator [Aureibacter tunicatorum]
MAAKRVLIAEDSSVIQNLTRKILIIQNFEIDAVKDGEKVLSKLEKKKYDVIIMDINMPKMDGMECARQIRSNKDPEIANLPIIAISGNAKNYTEEDFKTVGFNDYLQKPLDFDFLVDTVKKYTDQ